MTIRGSAARWCAHPAASIAFLVLLPLVAHLPALLADVQTDPLLIFSGLGQGARLGFHGFGGGPPYLDPHVGLTTQAVGRLAAMDWLHGIVPWWNPYIGIGLPLAGEMIPGAFFLPFVLLLALPGGVLWLVMSIQVLAGLAMLALLRTLGLGRLAALAGASLFALNGTLAWSPGPIAVGCAVPFLPLLVLGIERVAGACAEAASPGRPRAELGMILIGAAIAGSILSGFPETAYIDGVLGLVWVAFRFAHNPRRFAFLFRVCLGGTLGLLLAAPLLVAFAADLVSAPDIFAQHLVGSRGLNPRGLPMMLLPSVFGPPAGASITRELALLWGNIGGYGGLLVLLLALAQFLVVGRRLLLLRLVLALWVVASIGKTFAIEPFMSVINHIPAMPDVAFYRYAEPSWEFALIVLAAFGVDALPRVGAHRAVLVAAAPVAALAVAAVWFATPLAVVAGKMRWTYVAAAWAALDLALVAIVCIRARGPVRARLLAALAFGDALLLFWMPQLVGNRGGTIDLQAVRYLQANAGLQRVYTVGPLWPNYSTYFGIASINHNILPVPAIWLRAVDRDLFPGAVKRDHGITFWPAWGPPDDSQGALDTLAAHLPAFQDLAVRYILTAPGQSPTPRRDTPVPAGTPQPLMLAPGEGAAITAAGVSGPYDISRVGLTVGTYGGRADGDLAVSACAAERCGSGTVALRDVTDNGFAVVDLADPLPVPPGAVLRITLSHQGGAYPVALWTWPGATDLPALVSGPAGAPVGAAVRVSVLYGRPFARHVLTTPTSVLWELDHPAPYFEAVPDGSCTLSDQTREAVRAECREPATLLRRELAMPGWTARVGGRAVAVAEHDGLFQAIALPAGTSAVRFAFAPPYADLGWAASALGVLGFGWLLSRWRRRVAA